MEATQAQAQTETDARPSEMLAMLARIDERTIHISSDMARVKEAVFGDADTVGLLGKIENLALRIDHVAVERKSLWDYRKVVMTSLAAPAALAILAAIIHGCS